MKKLFITLLFLTTMFLGFTHSGYTSPLIGFDGSITLSYSTWVATLYYQVYGMNDSSNPAGIDVPYYSYFYRATHDSGTASLKNLTVGNPAQAPIVSINTVDYSSSGLAPAEWEDGGDSIIWRWKQVSDGGQGYVSPSTYSDWCYYTTPKQPGWVPGSLQDGGQGDTGTVPGPVPEPTSMLLLGIGLVGLAGGKVRKRFKAQPFILLDQVRGVLEPYKHAYVGRAQDESMFCVPPPQLLFYNLD